MTDDSQLSGGGSARSDAVDAHLSSPETIGAATQIAQSFGLPEDGKHYLTYVATNVATGAMDLSILPILLSVQFSIDEAKAAKLAAEVAGRILLPVRQVIDEDVGAQIRAWGGDLSQYGDLKSVDTRATTESFVREFLATLGAKMEDARMQSRFEYILVSMANGVRDGAQTAAVLMRGEKVGGLEMEKDAAEALVKMFGEKMRAAGFGVRPSVPAPVAPAPTHAPEPIKPVHLNLSSVFGPAESPEPEEPGPSASRLGEDAFNKGDEEEIRRHAKRVAEKLIPASPIQKIEDAVARAVEESGISFKDDAERKKFSSVVDARLRDVRDAYETRTMLENPAEQGGIGLSGGVLAKALETIEHTVDDWRKVEKQASEGTRQKEVVMPNVEMPPVKPAAVTTPEKTQKPAPVTPRLSASSVTATPGAKPKVEDVKFVRKLAGPIEELAGLSVLDFRRLASDPRDATLKIKDKIDLLEEQGYEKRIQAIKAWRDSPVNRLYLDLTRQALGNGRAVSEIAEERRRAGQETLSPDELQAILKLNGELRF